MDTELQREAKAILRAIRAARIDLASTDRKRAAAARSRFSAFTKGGQLSAQARDVYYASGVRGVSAALDTLESLAELFASEE